MLTSLRVKNLALMDSASLELEEGFTVVTGETGAGKSVLLGALSLLAGNRVGKTVVRKGADTCEVEGVLQFADTAALDAALDALGLPACEDGQLILRRTLSLAKPARVHINGAAATLAQLESLGGEWIDFHGPGEPQKLFHESRQLEMLDLFAGAPQQKRLAHYAARYRDWRTALREIENIRSQEKMSEDEIAFTRSQLERMGGLDLSDDGVAALERDFKKINSARELGELFTQLDTGLGGEGGLCEKLPLLLRAAREIASLDDSAADLEKRLHAVAIELADIQSDCARLAGEANRCDPATQEEINARMNLWLELRRKHGPAPDSVRAKRDALAKRLALQSDIAGSLEKAAAAAAEIETELRTLAAALREAREEAAGKLADAAAKMLGNLGFKRADLRIRVTPHERLTETGDTACEFLFQPNAGQDLLPLNKIASSGETARVMLALKTVLAGVDKTPVLVFDEVDANVGGETGAQVGRELAALSGRHQVFCVTHLPQVAAWGRQHFLVEKKQTADATAVSICAIHGDTAAREEELARMLGDRKSASALGHARELLGQRKTKTPRPPSAK
ncbi:MAG: DNA repair protein RecN [Puniceicoccales bacterium]|jgi:DNA repair protein RecN (Recombination protein N)|nr:DNA repair protein RecN [Puniceicoccales bacterium]